MRASRKYLLGLGLLLVAGAVIGWSYDHLERGLLIATSIALLWQVRQLLAFARAMRTRDFDAFRYGDGIWQQIFSRFSYEHSRAARRKRRHVELLKEVRKSTNAMPDGTVILNADNEIVSCNKAAKMLAGLKPKKDRGQRVDNILRDPALPALLQAGNATRSIEFESPVHENTWLNCRVVPYGADQKLLFLRDVTERMQLSRMRRDFVANASHELRSPLTVISGYLDSLAEDRAAPAEWEKPVAQMRSQARRMNLIVAELLELSRLESAGPASVDELVDVGALLAAAGDTYRGSGDSAAIEIAAESGARLRGCGNEIESLISNLVRNAARHTSAEGLISLIWRADADGAQLIVRDTGEGIAAVHLPRLTERFYRVDRGRGRDDGGIGLGLAIVKHILGRHDADLDVVSQPGIGSEFICRFPSARVAPSQK